MYFKALKQVFYPMLHSCMTLKCNVIKSRLKFDMAACLAGYDRQNKAEIECRTHIYIFMQH